MPKVQKYMCEHCGARHEVPPEEALRRKLGVAELRFWAKVERSANDPNAGTPDAECWGWLGAYLDSGHPVFGALNFTTSARRWAWYFVNREWPKHPKLYTICGNTDCINPDHAIGVGEPQAPPAFLVVPKEEEE